MTSSPADTVASPELENRLAILMETRMVNWPPSLLEAWRHRVFNPDPATAPPGWKPGEGVLLNADDIEPFLRGWLEQNPHEPLAAPSA